MDKHIGTLPSTSPQLLKLHLDIDYVLHTDTGSSYRAVNSMRTAFKFFQLLVQRSGTQCQMNSEIRRVILTVSNNFSRQFCLACTSATTTLGINLTICVTRIHVLFYFRTLLY